MHVLPPISGSRCIRVRHHIAGYGGKKSWEEAINHHCVLFAIICIAIKLLANQVTTGKGERALASICSAPLIIGGYKMKKFFFGTMLLAFVMASPVPMLAR